ncbi:MAG: ATP-binding protein [Acidobacteriota bacterium]
MTLRTKFLVYVVMLHGLLAAAAAFLLKEHRDWLLAVEAVFLLSILVAIRLVRSFSVPLDLIRTGTELINEADFTTHFTPVGQAEMDRLIGVYNRMIDQLREERLRVREQNELLDRLVEASPGGIVLCDFDGRITDLNPSAEALLGVERAKAVGQSLAQLESRSTLAAALVDLATGESQVIALGGGRRVKCQRAGFRDRGFARSFYLLAELTEELRQSEKAAYEKLIRMMSHEVNNSVGAVGSLLGSVRGAAAGLPPDERPEIEHAIDVAAERLDHLRVFMDGFADVVRLPEPDRRPCDVARLVDDLIVLLGPSMEERHIQLLREGERRLAPVDLDKNQIEQALVNVVKNAAEAIGEHGIITLRLGQDHGCGWIEIEDSGSGIPPEVAAQLFTPFFTTKDNGCGLGLTVVKEVLSRHDFPFSLENGAGGGARFRIDL